MTIVSLRRISLYGGLAVIAFAFGFTPMSARRLDQSKRSADLSPTWIHPVDVGDSAVVDLALVPEPSQMKLPPEAFAEISIDWFDDGLHLTEEAAYLLGLTNEERSAVEEIAQRTRDELQQYERENIYEINDQTSPFRAGFDAVFELEPLGAQFDEFLTSYRGALAAAVGEEASIALPLPYDMHPLWHKRYTIDDRGAGEIWIEVSFSQIEGDAELSSRGIALHKMAPDDPLPDQLTHLFELEQLKEVSE